LIQRNLTLLNVFRPKGVNMKKRNNDILQNSSVSDNSIDNPSIEETSRVEKSSVKRRRKFSLTDKLLLVLAILLLIGAIVLFSWNPIVNYLRDQKTSEVLTGIEKGTVSIVVDINALPVSGEELETFVSPTPGATGETVITPTLTPVVLPENVVLTALGTIKIDKIDLYIPLWNDAGIVPLRYGAGMLANTALPGQDGNCVILGHRMKAYGKLFNRLNEVAIGDSIVITSVDGTEYTYIVDAVVPKLIPADLINFIEIDDGSGKQLTLVTCTPTSVGSHRILVIAHIK